MEPYRTTYLGINLDRFQGPTVGWQETGQGDEQIAKFPAVNELRPAEYPSISADGDAEKRNSGFA